MKVKDVLNDALRYVVGPGTHTYQSPNSDHTLTVQDTRAGKIIAMEAAITAMELSMQKTKPAYLVARAEVDPKLIGVLPDPTTCLEQSLRFNVARPIDRNYLGDVISHAEQDALVFDKILVKDDAGVVLGVSWRQRGFNPMIVPENRVKFAKEAFGLTDAEIQEILAVQQG